MNMTDQLINCPSHIQAIFKPLINKEKWNWFFFTSKAVKDVNSCKIYSVVSMNLNKSYNQVKHKFQKEWNDKYVWGTEFKIPNISKTCKSQNSTFSMMTNQLKFPKLHQWFIYSMKPTNKKSC